MATFKLASLAIRTLAKPISNKLKQQAQEHPRFRALCISFAQWSYRTEIRLRTGLLGESPKAIRPLSETRAVQNGANNLAEGFLFVVAAGIIGVETWRQSRSQAKRRDVVDDQLEELESKVKSLTEELKSLRGFIEERTDEVQSRQEDMAQILDRIVYIGLRGGWAELQDTPLKIPRTISTHPHPPPTPDSLSLPSPPSSPPPTDTRATSSS
ncbi:hypothetical protein FRC02_011672 [Tulasnella sp. 418]|nr:hypothetical protein FRC02_011672 [Tulasnella sp. 418]